MRLPPLPVAIALALPPAAALAHPHEWVDVASEVLFDGEGRIAAVRHHWRFDEAFSAFALQGLDSDRDGAYSPAELEPLAKVNVESLAEFSFFTFVSAGDYRAGFAAPKDYRLELEADRLTLHFTLPLAAPLFTRGAVLVQVYDPEYYIAFSLPSAEAVRLVDAPAGCRLAVTPAEGPNAGAAAALATVGPEQRELPADMQRLTGGIDNSAEISCGAPAAVAAASGAAVPQDARQAANMLAEAAPGVQADLRALPAASAAATDAAGAASAPGLYARFAARVAALQAGFNRQITASLKNLKADGSAFWWLGGLSFLYGIAHAAGPGHGKVVISSYLVANEQRIRRGVLIAFLAALLQAAVAVALISVMAALLDMTSVAIGGTAKLFEAGSFALVAALGLYLLARKGRQLLAVVGRRSPSPLWGGGSRGAAGGGAHHAGRSVHDYPHHHHAGGPHTQADPHAVCRHHHIGPEHLENRGFSGALAAILSVGIRPCSGALVVLVFALAQGIFWAGIASTFLMALGTAITVAALAALAVGAKDVAARLAGNDGRRAARLMLGLELVAALFVTALGATLFIGAVAA